LKTRNSSVPRHGRRSFMGQMAAVSIAGFAPGLARAQDQVVNVGVLQPLSGANAQFGINSRQGIELVTDEINAAGGIKSLGGAKINLIVVDSTSTPTTAATAAQRLITQNQCVAILGAFASSLTLAASQVTERRGIPLLTMSFSDELTQRGFKNIFQVVSKASVLGRDQFDYAVAATSTGKKISKVSIMYEDTAYGTSQAKGLRDAAKAAQVEIVQDDAYPLGISDVTPMINKLRGSGAEIVFPVSYLNDSLLIIRTMRQQKLDMPVIGGAAGYVIPDFAEALGEYAEGILSISPANYDQAPEFTDRYRKRFGEFMTHEALENAVCMGVLAQAIDIAKSDKPAAVRDALSNTHFTEGWAKAMSGGSVKFDETGLNTKAQPVLVQWQNKELVSVYPKELAKGPIILS